VEQDVTSRHCVSREQEGKEVLMQNKNERSIRLITVLHYSKVLEDGNETGGHAYIRSFLTHKEYDNPANWDRKFGQ
jgi:hypothetical protein